MSKSLRITFNDSTSIEVLTENEEQAHEIVMAAFNRERLAIKDIGFYVNGPEVRSVHALGSWDD